MDICTQRIIVPNKQTCLGPSPPVCMATMTFHGDYACSHLATLWDEDLKTQWCRLKQQKRRCRSDHSFYTSRHEKILARKVYTFGTHP